MTSQFVGPRYRLKGRKHADWGALLVVFQNGKPDRIVPPGGRTFRGFRAPTIGDLEVCDVNVDVVDVTATFRNLPTRDGFVVESVTVTAQSKLNPAGNYVSFTRFLQRTGPRFGDALLERLRQDLDRRVRNSFRAVDHKDLFGQPLTYLGPRAKEEVIDDDELLVLTSLSVTDVQWSEAFIRLQQQDVLVNIAKADAALDRVKVVESQANEGAAAIARIDAFEEAASRLGVPVAALSNPDLIQIPQERAHALLMQMLDPANKSAAIRNPEVLAALLQASGLSSVPDFGAGRQQSANVVNAVAETKVPMRSLPPRALNDTQDIAHDYTVDRRCLRVWLRAAPGAERIVGLGCASANGRSSVVALGANQEPSVIPEVHRALAQLLNAASVDIISLPAGPPDLVAVRWFERVSILIQAIPGMLTVGTALQSATPGFEVLEILVSGPVREARALVNRLNATDLPYLSALAAVMPYADVIVKLDERKPA